MSVAEWETKPKILSEESEFLPESCLTVTGSVDSIGDEKGDGEGERKRKRISMVARLKTRHAKDFMIDKRDDEVER